MVSVVGIVMNEQGRALLATASRAGRASGGGGRSVRDAMVLC